MESYVVRIYRRDVDDVIAGVVEDTLSRRKKSFQSMAELLEWLRCPPRAKLRPTSGGVVDPNAKDSINDL